MPDIDVLGVESEPLRAFAYLSTPVVPFSDDALNDLLRSARRFNAARDVTGKLVVLEDDDGVTRFAQWIEGPARALALCVERIESDTRHADLQVIRSGPVAARRFPGWDMAIHPASATTFDGVVAQAVAEV
ncbi:BLUF domain-containing protein [Rubrivirga marina]|uniref:BLUF domain-containing protein n=1 Tax=Rubrivirga marina TaxID=1196024 RepID=A0A271IXA5_9BACT|nr:BLUF domain-containing protein [Rubrivirga marina]PAP75717.1 hypothetical protein BSZ37_04325 [Rubrivirga marina]